METRVSKYATDPDFVKIVEDIEKGVMTKKQAALQLGLTSAEFATRVRRAGFKERLAGIRDLSGDHIFRMDPEKGPVYEEAVTLALKIGPGGGAAALRKFPELNRATFYRRLREAQTAREPHRVPKKGPPSGHVRQPDGTYLAKAPAATFTLNPVLAAKLAEARAKAK